LYLASLSLLTIGLLCYIMSLAVSILKWNPQTHASLYFGFEKFLFWFC
jgi:hypothetical protein